MYNKENFKSMFSGKDIDTTYFVETILYAQKQFKDKDICTLEELLGLGDSWSNRACIDKLCELGYIKLVKEGGICNHDQYRNFKL